METRAIRSLDLCFAEGQERAAQLVGLALERGLDRIGQMSGLEAPADCRVCGMISWPRFLFHAAPWTWRIYLAVTLPLRYAHIRRMWDLAGGWALRF